MARTKPGIVYSAASTSGGRPSSFSVAEVIGPMAATATPSSSFCESLRPVSFTKFFAVEELVKVIIEGFREKSRLTVSASCEGETVK